MKAAKEGTKDGLEKTKAAVKKGRSYIRTKSFVLHGIVNERTEFYARIQYQTHCSEMLYVGCYCLQDLYANIVINTRTPKCICLVIN